MTWIWANARRQRKTEEPGMLQSMGSQTARYYLATEQQAYIHKTNFILYTVLYIYGKLGGGAWHTHTTIKPVNSKGNLNIYWKDWRWSSNALATCPEEPTLWKRPWCWERLRAGGGRGNRGWDGWMASLTQWTWLSIPCKMVKDREAWRTAVHGVKKRWTWLSNSRTTIIKKMWAEL